MAPDYQTVKVLASFDNSNGNGSLSALLVDAKGDVFGTNPYGGTYNHGTIFEWSSTTAQLTTLVNFQDSNGSQPTSALSADGAGNLYGVADNDIFEITNSGYVVAPEPSCLSILALGAIGLSRRPRPR